MITATPTAYTVVATFDQPCVLNNRPYRSSEIAMNNGRWAIEVSSHQLDDSVMFSLVNMCSASINVDLLICVSTGGEFASVGRDSNCTFKPGSGWGWKSSTPRSAFIKALSGDNKLRVCADIAIPAEGIYIDQKEWRYEKKEGSALCGLKSLWDTPTILPADVWLNFPSTGPGKEKKVPAHKMVLVARSPVFRAMLMGHMQEANTCNITIPNVEEAVVRAFVRFLYCDSCAAVDLQAHALDLLAMADQYDVPALLSVCEAYLSSHLTVKNALSMLKAADLHRASKLKEGALAYIAGHAEDLVLEDAFCEEAGPALMTDITRALVRSSHWRK
jgi:hypothetical protein